MKAFTEQRDAFPSAYGRSLRKQILKSPLLAANTLNRDFVTTRGYSVIFRRDSVGRVVREFPYLERYIAGALEPDCNAFYLNPLVLSEGSQVDPHIDRSLQSYVVHVEPPATVSVLYVEVPSPLVGGALVLRRGRTHVGRVTPTENMLVRFQGDLTHSVERVEAPGTRISVVCEQYRLSDAELERIPDLAVQSRASGHRGR